MDTLQWLLKHSFKGIFVFATLFVAVFVFKFFVPDSVKAYLRSFHTPSFDFLPPPGSLAIHLTPAPTPGGDDTPDKPSDLGTYFQNLNVAPGSVISEGGIFTGYARGTFFSKDDSGFSVQVIRKTDDGITAPVMYSRGYTKGSTVYAGFVPWSARITYMTWKGPCTLIFRKDITATGFTREKTIYTEIPVICR